MAQREIVAAIRMLFDGGDTVPVHVLAAAVRVITTSLCNKRAIGSYLDIAKQEHPHLSWNEIYKIAGRHARFFKRADRDADGTLTDYSNEEATHALFIASHGLFCSGKPVKVQAFDWPRLLLTSQRSRTFVTWKRSRLEL